MKALHVIYFVLLTIHSCFALNAVNWDLSTDIPRACSTETTSKFPFCDPQLSLDERINDLIKRLDLTEKPPMLTARKSPKGNVPRLGIPEYDWGANCLHGVQSRCAGMKCPTAFPSPNGLGATFNTSSWQEMGAIIGIELRALWLQGVGEAGRGYPHIGLDCWSPSININRDPRWGRNMEIPSEDPYISGQFGAAISRGLQEGTLDPRFMQAVVTIKHWAAFSFNEKDNVTCHNFDAKISDYDLLDTYFPAIKASVVEGKAHGVMCSYNALNGIPTCASSFLNTTLRTKWGFDGYVVSDSGAIGDILGGHHYATDPYDAVARALNDGWCDVNSGGVYDTYMCDAVKKGVITEAEIDRALYNSIKLRFELGLFDPIDDQPYWHIDPSVIRSEAHEQSSLISTLESLVLLKNNDKILPFAKGKKVAVLGPHGNATTSLLGNYNGQVCPGFSWDTSCVVSPFLAIQSENTGGTTVYSEGCTVTSSSTKGFDHALSAANDSDYVVLILGLNLEVETEGRDRNDGIGLTGVQIDFSYKVFALGKPTVVVLINGGMVAMEFLSQSAPAIIEAWYPGFYGGTALAKVIFGDYSPAGRLPITLYSENFIHEVDYLSMDMTKAPGRTYKYHTGTPLYEFGHGLSYTEFKLEWSHNGTFQSGIGIVKSFDSVIEYVCNVTNTGSVTGDEVVLAFFVPQDIQNDMITIVPQKQLFGFQRVTLKPGQSITLHFTLTPQTMALVTESGSRVVSRGKYQIQLTDGVDIVLKSVLLIDFDPVIVDTI